MVSLSNHELVELRTMAGNLASSFDGLRMRHGSIRFGNDLSETVPGLKIS